MRRNWGLTVFVVAVSLVLLIVVPVGATTTTSQLKTKVLSLSDLPTGWSIDKSSTSSSTTGGCLAGLKPTHNRGTKVSVSYKDGQLLELNELLASGTKAQAYTGYNRINHILAGCKHFTVTSKSKKISVTVGAMAFPAVADRSNAYAASFAVAGIHVGFDLILFRVGSIDGLIDYVELGQPEEGVVQALVTEAVDKAEGKQIAISTTV